jgi:hypothetical protein
MCKQWREKQTEQVVYVCGSKTRLFELGGGSFLPLTFLKQVQKPAFLNWGPKKCPVQKGVKMNWGRHFEGSSKRRKNELGGRRR